MCPVLWELCCGVGVFPMRAKQRRQGYIMSLLLYSDRWIPHPLNYPGDDLMTAALGIVVVPHLSFPDLGDGTFCALYGVATGRNKFHGVVSRVLCCIYRTCMYVWMHTAVFESTAGAVKTAFIYGYGGTQQHAKNRGKKYGVLFSGLRR